MLTSDPVIETVGVGVLKVTLSLSERDGTWYTPSKSPGGTVVAWRQTGEMVQHLRAGDQITLAPLEPARSPQPWYDEREYQTRVTVSVIYWMSRPPP
jgi:hypothetical protein